MLDNWAGAGQGGWRGLGDWSSRGYTGLRETHAVVQNFVRLHVAPRLLVTLAQAQSQLVTSDDEGGAAVEAAGAQQQQGAAAEPAVASAPGSPSSNGVPKEVGRGGPGLHG